MATRAELRKELGEDGMGTRNPVIGGSKEDGTLIHNEGLHDIGKNTPIVNIGVGGYDTKKSWDNGDTKGVLVNGAGTLAGAATLGGGVINNGVGGAVKNSFTPKGVAVDQGTSAAIEKAGDTVFGKDNGTTKMLTPSLDIPSKDKPKSDDDGKSELQKLKDDPLGYLKDLPQRLWDKLRGKDDDDNQLAKDDNGKDPQGKDTPNDNPEKQPTEPNGQGETDPNGNPEPLQVPGAGGGFGAGLGNGNGAGTKDLGDPKTPFYDPLLIALQTGGNNTSISVVSHNEENGGKMLDLNGDGIANNVSWIGKDTGVLFYDENNNGKFDGIACNDKLYFQAA